MSDVIVNILLIISLMFSSLLYGYHLGKRKAKRMGVMGMLMDDLADDETTR